MELLSLHSLLISQVPLEYCWSCFLCGQRSIQKTLTWACVLKGTPYPLIQRFQSFMSNIDIFDIFELICVQEERWRLNFILVHVNIQFSNIICWRCLLYPVCILIMQFLLRHFWAPWIWHGVCLGHCSSAMKKHHDQGNSWWLAYSYRGSSWWETDRRGAGEVAEDFTSWPKGSRERQTDIGQGMGFET